MKGLKTILNGLLLLTMAVGMMSCQGLIDAVLGNDDVPVSTDVPSAKKMLLEVMGERYEVALPASEPLNLRTLTNEFDITVKVRLPEVSVRCVRLRFSMPRLTSMSITPQVHSKAVSS